MVQGVRGLKEEWGCISGMEGSVPDLHFCALIPFVSD